MKQMNIGQRLAVTIGALLAILAGIAVLGSVQLARLYDRVDLVVHDFYPKVAMTGQAFEDVKDASVHLRNLALVTDPVTARRERAALDAAEVDAKTILSRFAARVSSDKGREVLAALTTAKQAYDADRAAYLDLLARDERQAAIDLLFGRLAGHLDVYEQRMRQLNRIGGTLMNKSADEASAVYRAAKVTIAAMTLAALLLASILAYRMARSITVPLRQAVKAAETIATGNLTATIDCTRTDEAGRLLQALRAMNGSLVNIVGGVRANAEAIADGAAEIAEGTIDLSARTEEQASSLEETASVMEELTSTVRQTADNARHALEVTRSAADVAERGGAQVRQVVARMAAIEESSRRIADIIAVIDGIASQTNILALNAAVEAARAGEQGRGFAVVASEVRNLAQRSAGAAREIRLLIGDSVDKIAAGGEFANAAGSTMETVLSEIRRVAALMNDIEAAAGEQAAGIEQINQAIAQMDHVTQQNASLVEEAAAAAETMQQRTAAMRSSVRVFVLDEARAVPMLSR